MILNNKNGEWESEISKIALNVRLKKYDGIVESNLYEAGERIGLSAYVINQLADIFEYDIDFAHELKKNDHFTILIEKYYKENNFVKFGKILLAKFYNNGKPYEAYWFAEQNINGYFNAKGQPLRKTFMRSPVSFQHITSKFSYGRLHPILKVRRPHLGIDYAAPVGTPIRAVGAGIIEYLGWKGGNGKFIKIRHNNMYSSSYSHLSRFNSNFHSGRRVNQGDVIGYVGSTGLATGPHLHFAFYKYDKYVNPLKLTFQVGTAVPAKYLEQFYAEKGKYLSLTDEPILRIAKK